MIDYKRYARESYTCNGLDSHVCQKCSCHYPSRFIWVDDDRTTFMMNDVHEPMSDRLFKPVNSDNFFFFYWENKRNFISNKCVHRTYRYEEKWKCSGIYIFLLIGNRLRGNSFDVDKNKWIFLTTLFTWIVMWTLN